MNKITTCCKATYTTKERYKMYEREGGTPVKLLDMVLHKCDVCKHYCTLEDTPDHVKKNILDGGFAVPAIEESSNTESMEERTLERFAEMEHIRWAKWQNYMHSFLTWNNDLQAWVLPHEKKARWQSQIETPYAFLPDKQKESDREQVKPYLNFIKSELERRDRELVNKARGICNEYMCEDCIAFVKEKIINLIQNNK